MDKKDKEKIPFGKAARVGNYKLWRSRTKMTVSPSDEQRAKVREESGGRKKAVSRSYDIEQINISNLDGSWKVCIPETAMMYGTLMMAYSDVEPERCDEFLRMVFANMQQVCLNTNVYLHDGFNLFLEMMQYPYMLLPEKEMISRMRDGLNAEGLDKKRQDEHIDKWVEHRKKLYAIIDEKINRCVEDYEEGLKERKAKEAEAQNALEQEEIAEQALDILNGKEEKSEV